MIARSVILAFLLVLAQSTAMQNVIEIANSGEFSVLNTLLEHTAEPEGEPFLQSIFQENRPLTLFFARDAGFSELKASQYLAKLMLPSYRMHLYSLMSYQIADQSMKEVLEQPSNQNKRFSTQNLCGANIVIYRETDTTITVDMDNNESPAAMGNPIPTSDNAMVVPTDNVMFPDWITMDLYAFMLEHDAYTSISTFTTFSSLLVAGNMDDTVRESTDLTLFAPVNQGLSNDLVEDLLERPDALTDFLKHHMMAEVFNVRDLTEVQLLHTVLGECILANPTEKRGVLIGESQLKGYQLVREGVLYKISDALIPPTWR
ncbi:hypothetical protein FisN_14Hh144 [Fistulifera solaris]|jgi:uncharacterized surface protein with fasciclin (FAS1) repeats|uniref:FAS1 domain-containing protein n=1 Tax=Fistulifera solaris TaxID=1519565 RepID=A0A1Z5K8P1_FISSO|nr:hypothetical protein FisN_14Hh144 [Fistulifera solaris]|eukprot:GAX22522.1 hypothetical protein FisN_14Hh144 [Fistulifera solaris]